MRRGSFRQMAGYLGSYLRPGQQLSRTNPAGRSGASLTAQRGPRKTTTEGQTIE
jgi:hypothetical protein